MPLLMSDTSRPITTTIERIIVGPINSLYSRYGAALMVPADNDPLPNVRSLPVTAAPGAAPQSCSGVYLRPMETRRISATVAAILSATVALLASCGTFPLGNVQPQSGRSADQQQSDTLYCKDQAQLAANSAGRQTGDFLLGLTIVGAPVAYELDKTKEREVFASCMQEKGYTVIPPLESKQATVTAAKGSNTQTYVPSPSEAAPTPTNVKLNLPPGFEEKSLTVAQRQTGFVTLSLNRTADVGVSVAIDRHEGISDVLTYTTSRRAIQLSRLQDATASDVTTVNITGRKAYRFETNGKINGVRIAYVVTVVEGSTQLVIVSAWTSAANLSAQRLLLEGMAARVDGIQ